MDSKLVAVQVHVRGAVQGVGFRPFVYTLAHEIGLAGFVSNSLEGAVIQLEGPAADIEGFLGRLATELPSPGFVTGLEADRGDFKGLDSFTILDSCQEGEVRATVLPDIATCRHCLAEMSDPSDRRYRYPFINCTHCGPRYSIVLGLPYDRPRTSMAGFAMCRSCAAEYRDPGNRRFHAQPIACPACGPQIEYWNETGRAEAEREEGLNRACDVIRGGGILALKGIGGFHLMADARDESAVRRLRERKHRYAKPLAVMVPTLEDASRVAEMSAEDHRLLSGPEAPIVILPAVPGALAPSIAPENPTVGVMLPYSPLHHLLMDQLGFPVVATSGNLSEEPICIDEHEAVSRFEGIADALLVHNRPIVRPVDDSVVRMMAGRRVVLRRARGYAPVPISVHGIEEEAIAVGGHLKNSVAVSIPGAAVVGQHVGDLDNGAARERMAEEAADLANLYKLKSPTTIHDLHPDYASTRFAESVAGERVAVQHHVAHAAACISENGLREPVLAVVWDGTGYGLDGTIWGGEFFSASENGIRRIGHLRSFDLVGGDTAAREGRRAALGLTHSAFAEFWPAVFERALEDSFGEPSLRYLKILLERRTGCVSTTSAGRLFDAFAFLGAGIERSRFEGDAAMRFEHLATEGEPLSFVLRDGEQGFEIDWQPALEDLLILLDRGSTPGAISAGFHEGLAEVIVRAAQRAGCQAVALTGGCFQNRRLLEGTWKKLADAGFRPYSAQKIPPNDGGIAFGQLCAFAKGWTTPSTTVIWRSQET